tara:strand:- start:78 stop:314 length:237 start_codon:yes stop_codon:yes gene_type:complete
LGDVQYSGWHASEFVGPAASGRLDANKKCPEARPATTETKTPKLHVITASITRYEDTRFAPYRNVPSDRWRTLGTLLG